MKTRLLKAGAVLSLLLTLALLPSGESLSCGPDLDESEFRFSLFRPDLDRLPALEPFYYTSRFLNRSLPDPAGEDYRRNCEEWRAYGGGAFSLREVHEIQYECNPDAFLYAAASGNWSAFGDNAFVRWLKQPARRAALRYLQLAKQVEFEQFGTKDPWQDDASPYTEPVASASDSLLLKSLDGYRHADDAFLRQRYAFQLTKLCYYHESAPGESISRDTGRVVFEEYLRNKHTVVADWGLLFYSGLLQDSLASYAAMVQAFLRSEEKKVFVYHNLSRAELHALLAHSKDPEVQAGACVLLALKTPGPAMDLIRKVHSLRPDSKYLPLLIGREVNKIEEWLWTAPMLNFDPLLKEAAYTNLHYNGRPDNYDYKQPDTTYTYYAALNARKDRAYCQRFTGLLENLSAGEGGQAPYARLAAAHLYNVIQQFAAADRLLRAMPAFKQSSWEQQRLIDEIIARAHLQDVRSGETRDYLITGIRRLQELGLSAQPMPQEMLWDYDVTPATKESTDNLQELLLLLSKRFEQAGDRLRAGLLYRKANLLTNRYDGSDYYYSELSRGSTDSFFTYQDIAYYDRCGSAPLMDSLIAYQQQPSPGPFDRFLLEHSVDANFYRDLKGTILFRAGRYADALAVFNTMPDSFWETEYAYASYLPRTDIGSAGSLIPGERPGPKLYPASSKKLIARSMLQLEDSLTQPMPALKKAALLYRLGNALYQTSYHGNAWMMFSYGKSGRTGDFNNDDGNWYNPSFPRLYRQYGDRYYRLVPAMRCYQQAAALAGRADRELAARCMLMLAHCEGLQQETDYWGTPTVINGIRYYKKMQSGPPPVYLARLKRDYSHTALFDLAATHCPDVQAYLNR